LAAILRASRESSLLQMSGEGALAHHLSFRAQAHPTCASWHWARRPVSVGPMNNIPWLWIPIVFAASAAQTVRNAAQKNVTKTAGTLAGTAVRFIYGLPFAIVALAIAAYGAGGVLPTANSAFMLWVFVGALAQLAATALLLAAMQQRTFVVAVAYSKTEVLQVALFAVALLGEGVSASSAAAIVLASLGVILLSLNAGAIRGGSFRSWVSPTALLGVGSGAGFALSAVGYRGATLTLGAIPAWLAGTYALVWAQTIQSVLIGGYLAWRNAEALKLIAKEWRVSLLAGFAGALASMGWFTAFAMRNAADVRTLALVEVLYGYAVSRRIFKEKTSGRETIGIALLTLGILLISAQL
jgi:drug/metabolite transporter (DMT)-like permease